MLLEDLQPEYSLRPGDEESRCIFAAIAVLLLGDAEYPFQ